MKIACLGWGSLIWDPGSLPIQREWFKDGPFAPIEFTRQSSDGRMTLVIEPGASPVQLLWAQMLLTDVQAAREALRDREHIPSENWSSKIGSWRYGDPGPAAMGDLPKWADTHELDAVIWTALSPKFNSRPQTPSVDQVIEYLPGLTGTQRDHAKEYIEKAPRQIVTGYRSRIEAALGWVYQER